MSQTEEAIEKKTTWKDWWTVDDQGEFCTLLELAQHQEDIAEYIARSLGEKNGYVINEIKRIVGLIGSSAALTLLNEAHQAEQNGGMLTIKGDRKRTPGGVFFVLFRSEYPSAGRELFRLDRHRWKQRVKDEKKKALFEAKQQQESIEKFLSIVLPEPEKVPEPEKTTEEQPRRRRGPKEGGTWVEHFKRKALLAEQEKING